MGETGVLVRRDTKCLGNFLFRIMAQIIRFGAKGTSLRNRRLRSTDREFLSRWLPWIQSLYKKLLGWTDVGFICRVKLMKNMLPLQNRGPACFMAWSFFFLSFRPQGRSGMWPVSALWAEVNLLFRAEELGQWPPLCFQKLGFMVHQG